ncbi:hypothetical protein PI23P_11142 [Polaribacter irgensii 23-P]|uniref:Lipoprotein n=1 Tax=Polaribacter irgensii 23-P TaxID=313594 RepID=A4C181_9FLAO|nr:hypothetical protein PI23P_11142 [Polaribacter irgensii 23-P]
MNVFKILRNKRIIILFSLSFLFFSCSQYELNNKRVFDYAMYQAYKDNPVDMQKVEILKSKLKKGFSKSEINEQILNLVNDQYHTNLKIPKKVLYISDINIDEMKSFSLSESLISKEEIKLIDELSLNIGYKGLDSALKILEDKVIASNLDIASFKKYNNLAISLKVVNIENPQLFNNNNQQFKLNKKGTNLSKIGILACIVAIIVWIAAVISFVPACATWVLCGFAGFALIAATVEVILECVPNTPEQ